MHEHWKHCFFPLLLSGLMGQAQAAPLDFETAIRQAERHSPLLAAFEARAAAARSAVQPASALPDPKVFIGLENYPVSGMDAWSLDDEGMTMQTLGLMQDIPNRAKRRARGEVAGAEIAIVAEQGRAARLAVRRDAALAWLELHYLQRKAELFEELERENAALALAVQAQIKGNRAPLADTVMPRQEALMLADRRDDFNRELQRTRARLQRLVGGGIADATAAGEPPLFVVDAGRLRRHLQSHPELQALAAATRKAEAEVQEATAMKKPDWAVELAFQRRDPRFGNMVSLQLSFDLPLSPATRQDPLIAARQQEVARMRSEQQDMLYQHSQELEEGLADFDTLTRQLERALQQALPLIEEKLELGTAAYKAGKNELSNVLAARRERIEQRLNIIDLESRRAAAAVRLHYAYEEAAP